jgi:hypothetical protein
VSILDGFKLWIGKMLADLLLGLVVMLSIVVVVAVIAAIQTWRGK